MSHSDEMTCMLYLDGQLERTRARELSAHVENCPECRALLRSLETESRWLAHALAEEDEAMPARLLAPPERDATPWAWIVSFGLAAAGAYTLWTGIVEPWREQFNQAGLGESNLITMLLFGGVFWKGWESVANLLQLLAVTTLGLVAFGLLRRGWRRWTTVAVVMGTIVAVLVLPPQAAAAEIRHGQRYVLAKDEVVKNDLIAMGESARIDGTVDGDLIFFGKSVTIDGHVTGDVLSFGQLVRINGRVDGDVRTIASTLTLSGPIGKNVTAFAENIELESKSRVGGGMMLFAANANLDGRLNRDLLGVIAKTTLDGFVGGNVRIHGERLSIGSSAEIAGKARYKGKRQPEISSGAKLASPLEITIEKRRPDYASPRFYWKLALRWGAAFLFGLAMILLVPGLFSDAVRSTRHYGASLGFGALALIVTPIVAVIACITIVGLALGLGTFLLWIIALYTAHIFVGAWLGEIFMGAPASTGAAIGRMAVGLLVIKIVWMVPYLGFLARLIVVAWGLGALALAIYNRSRQQAAPMEPAPVGV